MTISIALALAAGISITLPERADVRGTELRLGDIARVEGADAELVRRVVELELGWVQAPGYSRLLDGAEIAARLRKAVPGIDLELGGETRCRVYPSVEHVAADAIVAAARAELRALHSGREVELSLESPPAGVDVPLGAEPARLSVPPQRRSPAGGRISIPVRIDVDGAPYRTVWTSWTVDVWESVPVLVRAVRRGEVVQPALFEVRRVRRAAGAPAAAPEYHEGLCFARDVPAGATLVADDLVRERVIQRGDLVHLEVRRGAVTARAAVVAAQDGRVGDRIRLTRPETGHEVVATVVSSKWVRIQID